MWRKACGDGSSCPMKDLLGHRGGTLAQAPTPWHSLCHWGGMGHELLALQGLTSWAQEEVSGLWSRFTFCPRTSEALSSEFGLCGHTTKAGWGWGRKGTRQQFLLSVLPFQPVSRSHPSPLPPPETGRGLWRLERNLGSKQLVFLGGRPLY